jgi:chromosome segregation ATPase
LRGGNLNPPPPLNLIAASFDIMSRHATLGNRGMDAQSPPENAAQLSSWFAEAAARLDEFQAHLCAQVTDLEAREAALNAREAALRELEIELERRRQQLQQRSEDLERQGATLSRRENELAARESALSLRQEQVDQAGERVSQAARHYELAAERLSRQQAELAERWQTLQRCEEAIARFQRIFEHVLSRVEGAAAARDPAVSGSMREAGTETIALGGPAGRDAARPASQVFGAPELAARMQSYGLPRVPEG